MLRLFSIAFWICLATVVIASLSSPMWQHRHEGADTPHSHGHHGHGRHGHDHHGHSHDGHTHHDHTHDGHSHHGHSHSHASPHTHSHGRSGSSESNSAHAHVNLLGWTFTFALPDWQTDVSPALPPPRARHSSQEPAAADAAITGTIVHNRWTFRVASLFDFQLAEPPGRFIWIVACDSEPAICVSDFRPIHFDDPPPLPPP